MSTTISKLFLCGIALLALFEAKSQAANDRPLNFVVILVDDLGWTDLSCQGSKYYETPHIDQLASRGMRFTNAYAACAVCSPTRAAMMTGRYPARIGITDWIRANFQRKRVKRQANKADRKAKVKQAQSVICPKILDQLPLEELTIAEALGEAGYKSCHIGKWHLGDLAFYPDRQGFAYNLGGCDLGQPPSYFDPFKNSWGDIPTLTPRKTDEYLTDREADEAVQFIRNNQDKPFFLYLAHYAVHMPIQAKQSVVEKYRAKPKTNHNNPTYAAMIESVDDAAGRMLTTLGQLGLTERTVVIFTSDNGGLSSFPGPTDNAPLRWGKGHAYEGGIRVPWIVNWPGVTRPGSTCDVPICTIDVFPTILAAADVIIPTDREIDGLDLRPLLDGEETFARNALYWHFPHYGGDQRRPYSIIRQGRWKLIHRYDTLAHELYDLEADLSEAHNLINEHPKLASQLERQLFTHLKSVGAKLPQPSPEY